MRNRGLQIRFIVGLTFGLLAARVQAEPVPPSLPEEVRQVLSAKCGQCHSERLAKPKGHFGYVTDLRRLASNPKLLTPADAEHSKLWQQIEDEEMPPDNAKAGPLTDAEKGLIRWWIAAGAPAPASVNGEPARASAAQRRPMPLSERLVRFAGRFHVLVVHFPIALLLAAALAEAWGTWTGRRGINPAVRYCVLLGALGAVAAAALGWARAPFVGWTGAAQTLLLHRWVGTAAGAVAIAAAVFSERSAIRARSGNAFRAALFASALLIGLAGHLGGTLVYGDGYFTW